MNVLITGGTGFIGSHVRDELLARPEMAGGRLARMTRDASGKRDDDPRVSYVTGDVRDAASLDEATRGIDAVVHCVQFPNHPVENPSKGYTYLEIDAKGTERLVAACVANGVRRVVYLSGAGTSPERPEPWFRAKVIAERAVRESGLEYVILRPSWIYGPDDNSLNKFVSFVRHLPIVPVVGDGTNRVQPVSIFDVARVAAAAVFEPEATNRVFDLGGPEELTMDEIVGRIQKVLGTHRVLFHQPAALVKLAAVPMRLLPSPPLSPAAVDFILQEAHVDPTPAEQTFGFAFRSLEAGLREYIGDDTRN
jgi:nucleoside-diphosphate-sugar epimerase